MTLTDALLMSNLFVSIYPAILVTPPTATMFMVLPIMLPSMVILALLFPFMTFDFSEFLPMSEPK